MLKQNSSEYNGFRSAGIRLAEPILPTLASHNSARSRDILEHIHAFDKAHSVMLTEERLISPAAGRTILTQLRKLEAGDVIEARCAVDGGMHSGEQYLIRTLGEEVGGVIHLGRSSGDLGAVSRRLALRTLVIGMIDAALAFRRSLIEFAHQHLHTIMPAYTQLQNGQPTTLGHWAAMWLEVAKRDMQRLKEFYSRLNLSPAGAVTLTGTTVALNRDRVATLLGFDGVLPHALDAVHSHDVDTIEAATVVTTIAVNLTRLADDLELWSTSEFGFIDLPDRFCGTSSIMMQKKNPYFSEEVKTVGAVAIGALGTAFAVARGATAQAVVEHKASDKEIRRTLTELRGRFVEAADLVQYIEVSSPNMQHATEAYWAAASDLGVRLVEKANIPWRSAHQIVGVLVRQSNEHGIAPSEVTQSDLDRAAVDYFGQPVGLSTEEIQEALDVRRAIEERVILGGTAPGTVQTLLAHHETELGEDRRWLADVRTRISESEALLENAIDAICQNRADPSGGADPQS